VTYEIDPGSANRARLEKALAPFMELAGGCPAATAAVPAAQAAHGPIARLCGPGLRHLA
jgi:hypothetical protein